MAPSVSNQVAPGVSYVDDDSALQSSAQGAVTSTSSSQGAGATAASVQRWAFSTATAPRVAAETGGSSVLRHYTTKEAAGAISKEGVLRAGASGKRWLTPHRYADGADASSL